jgi:hypothetical protein
LQIAGDPTRVTYVADLDLGLLDLGCPARDCIPSIDQPEFETPTEAQGWLKPTDLVVLVTYNGATKAYPVKILIGMRSSTMTSTASHWLLRSVRCATQRWSFAAPS